MKNNFARLRLCALVIMAMGLMLSVNSAYAEWHFGIGTGMARNSASGDQGFHTDIAGPVKYDLDLTPKDFDDLMQTAFGFGGYATNGGWVIQYSFSQVGLGGDGKLTTPGGTPVKVDVDFDITEAELTATRYVYKMKYAVLGVLGGVRYTKQKLSTDIDIGNPFNTEIDEDISNSWTDALIGASVTVPFSKKWAWNTMVNAGFGGSEGTYHVGTALTWRFFKHWSATANYQYTAVDFENDSKGDSDWYLYDVDESSYGITVMFNW